MRRSRTLGPGPRGVHHKIPPGPLFSPPSRRFRCQIGRERFPREGRRSSRLCPSPVRPPPSSGLVPHTIRRAINHFIDDQLLIVAGEHAELREWADEWNPCGARRVPHSLRTREGFSLSARGHASPLRVHSAWRWWGHAHASRSTPHNFGALSAGRRVTQEEVWIRHLVDLRPPWPASYPPPVVRAAHQRTARPAWP